MWNLIAVMEDNKLANCNPAPHNVIAFVSNASKFLESSLNLVSFERCGFWVSNVWFNWFVIVVIFV